MTLLSMRKSIQPTQSITETDQSLFAALLDMVSCGGKVNACQPKTYFLPANEIPSRRFDERDLLDDIFEGRVLPCGVRGQNNQKQLQPVFSNERDLLDHIFEGRIIPCGPNLTPKEEQIKRLFSDRRDLLDHIFEGRVFSGGVPCPQPNTPSNEQQVSRVISDQRDLLDDIFEGRVLPCGSPSHDNHDHMKQVVSTERDLLGDVFEGKDLSLLAPGNPCLSSNMPEESKRVFSDERDLLDDVIEGRIFSGAVPTNRCNSSNEPEKRESLDQRDLLDLVFEGKIFSGSTSKNPPKEENDQVKTMFEDKRNLMEKVLDVPLSFKHDQASDASAMTENDATPRNPETRPDQRVVDLPEERGCFQMLLEDFLCTCQANTGSHDIAIVPQPNNTQEESDLLDDVFDGRPGSGGNNHKETLPTKHPVPEKDALDRLFENVEQNVCGVETMPPNVNYDSPDIKRNRSLIDDASSVGSCSHVSRKGLWIFSPDGVRALEHPHSQKREIQKKNIIQSFLSRNAHQ